MDRNPDVELWQMKVESKLLDMIKDWEGRVPIDIDDTLYSLALRRALDVVRGIDPDLGP